MKQYKQKYNELVYQAIVNSLSSASDEITYMTNKEIYQALREGLGERLDEVIKLCSKK
jgi:hypothetical protein